ncbi:ABC transporter ATP-binding protein [Pseudoflavonifractor capillosus]|uniref:ABC transporter ATP-binding protein n=1 Tax=Pseudoflavonifractor capillosus TaxID=106588 RepID=A0A921MLX2_9FIRM|nr:ABC transporter ATP-binding protein [Pseudoflavonifractor capillosus]HJG86642.1 ABC transporter ATP-binding protein [Pseudoflavonifractor capillosus]
MIKVEHLTKYYGDFLAVDDLSFEIDEGHVYGFLGPNGAGKTTTMNIMTGCLSATSGRVEVGGYDIFEDARKAKRLIGYLPEQPPLYMNETPEEYLRFVGEAKGLRGGELAGQIDKVIAQVKIEDVRGRRISALSKGYKQRVGIAQALLGNPRVIILDEPTVGLDPIQIVEIRDLIKQLGQEHTVILSSHILSEVQAICEKILIIAHGKLVAFDEPDNLEKNLLSGSEIVFTTDAEEEQVMDILSGVEHISSVRLEEKENGLVSAQLKTDSRDIYAVSRQLFFSFAQHGQALLELSLKKASLEDIFIELTESGDPGQPGAGGPEDTPAEQPEAAPEEDGGPSAGTESEADQL